MPTEQEYLDIRFVTFNVTEINLINFEYSYTGIHEDTDLKYFDITLN